MKLLLDTHALIWFCEGNTKLTTPARAALENGDNDLYYSIASIWELAIKVQLGKLRMSAALEPRFRRSLERAGIRALAIEYAHAARVSTLPLHHRDPFDRLLVAQAMLEQMALVSHDTALDQYPVNRLW